MISIEDGLTKLCHGVKITIYLLRTYCYGHNVVSRDYSCRYFPFDFCCAWNITIMIINKQVEYYCCKYKILTSMEPKILIIINRRFKFSELTLKKMYDHQLRELIFWYYKLMLDYQPLFGKWTHGPTLLPWRSLLRKERRPDSRECQKASLACKWKSFF